MSGQTVGETKSITSLQPGLQLAGDYAIQVLMIITSDGTTIDIRSQAVEVNLYEDIFSPCMSGSILMGDAQDLITNFKMHGNEWLQIQIDKPGLNKPITKTFRIYKISEREYKTSSMQNYILHFCSEEMVLSTQQYISKAYKGMAISDMIKDVVVNKLGANNKINFWDTTQGVFNIVVPRMHPLECVQWLTTRSFSANGSLFLFYETADGYNFQAYETLLQRKTYKNYTYGVKLDNEAANTNYSMNFLRVVKDFDMIQTGQYGGYSTTLLAYDFINRTLNTAKIKATDMELLNDNPQVNQAQNRFKTPLTGADYLIKLYPMTDSDSSVNPSQPFNWLHIKALRLAQINSFKMVGTVPGDILLRAGSVITVELPISMPKTATSQAGNQLNDMRSGKYLVTAVHHIFINGVSTTVVELVSDSVTGQLFQSNDTAKGMQVVKGS